MKKLAKVLIVVLGVISIKGYTYGGTKDCYIEAETTLVQKFEGLYESTNDCILSNSNELQQFITDVCYGQNDEQQINMSIYTKTEWHLDNLSRNYYISLGLSWLVTYIESYVNSQSVPEDVVDFVIQCEFHR